MGVKVDYQNKIAVENLDTIYITGGGFVNYPFKGISRDSALGWQEAVWGGELSRSKDFTLTNIEDVDFGLVARCELSYKYMNIQDYVALMKIAKQRTCFVNYFNRETGERVIQEMAFTGNDLKNLYAFGTEYLGVLDVSIKLVATNRDLSGVINASHTISYNNNGGSGTIEPQTAIWSDNLILEDGSGFTNSGYSLSGFNTEADGSGWDYLPNQNITVFGNLTLYAKWVEA